MDSPARKQPRPLPVVRLPLRARGAGKPPKVRLLLLQHPAGDPPKTRADCERGPRPCPWIGCRFNNAEFFQRIPRAYGSCALDLAGDEREHTLREVADHIGCDDEHVRRIEATALAKLGRHANLVLKHWKETR